MDGSKKAPTERSTRRPKLSRRRQKAFSLIHLDIYLLAGTDFRRAAPNLSKRLILIAVDRFTSPATRFDATRHDARRRVDDVLEPRCFVLLPKHHLSLRESAIRAYVRTNLRASLQTVGAAANARSMHPRDLVADDDGDDDVAVVGLPR